MPRRRRQARIPTPAWERPRGAIGRRLLGRGGQFYGTVVVGLLVVVALAIVGYAFLNDYIEKQQRPGSTAVAVGDTKVRLDDFSRRLKMYVDQFGGQASGAAQPQAAVPAVSGLLIQEEIVRRYASELEVSASADEVKEGIATRIGAKSDDPTFDVVFKQELARSQLSEDEYRRMVEATVLAEKLKTELGKQLPKTAESVHFRQILVSSETQAQEIRDKLDAGEDFATLAAQNSLDSSTKDNGGDLGWIPRGVLSASLEELVFALAPKETTTIPISQGAFVIEMLEKDSNREVDQAQLTNLSERAFLDWLDEKKKSVKIVNNMVDLNSKQVVWAVKRAYQI